MATINNTANAGSAGADGLGNNATTNTLNNGMTSVTSTSTSTPSAPFSSTPSSTPGTTSTTRIPSAVPSANAPSAVPSSILPSVDTFSIPASLYSDWKPNNTQTQPSLESTSYADSIPASTIAAISAAAAAAAAKELQTLSQPVVPATATATTTPGLSETFPSRPASSVLSLRTTASPTLSTGSSVPLTTSDIINNNNTTSYQQPETATGTGTATTTVTTATTEIAPQNHSGMSLSSPTQPRLSASQMFLQQQLAAKQAAMELVAPTSIIATAQIKNGDIDISQRGQQETTIVTNSQPQRADVQQRATRPVGASASAGAVPAPQRPTASVPMPQSSAEPVQRQQQGQGPLLAQNQSPQLQQLHHQYQQQQKQRQQPIIKSATPAALVNRPTTTSNTQSLDPSQLQHDLHQLRLHKERESDLQQLKLHHEKLESESVATRQTGTPPNANNNRNHNHSNGNSPGIQSSIQTPPPPSAYMKAATDLRSALSATSANGSEPTLLPPQTSGSSVIGNGGNSFHNITGASGDSRWMAGTPATVPTGEPVTVPGAGSILGPMSAPMPPPVSTPNAAVISTSTLAPLSTPFSASASTPSSTPLSAPVPASPFPAPVAGRTMERNAATAGGTPEVIADKDTDTTTGSKTKPPGNKGGGAQVFKATYSGVPVYEMMCRGIAVMRRRSDSYLNATQILKVAEFDKPQRTRILEREVQRGEHEKVQGGYGKYQGTWVPFERGLQLCQEYNVLELLQPLLEYESKAKSPPLAPKHTTAASFKPRKAREPRPPGTPKSSKSKLKGPGGRPGPAMGVIDGSGREQPSHAFGDEEEDMSTSELEDHDVQTREGSALSRDETMSILSAQSRTPSPLGSRHDFSSSEVSDNEGYSRGQRRPRSLERSQRARKKPHRPGDELFIDYQGGRGKLPSSRQQTGYASPGGHRSRQPRHSDQDVEMYSRDERRPSPGHHRRGELAQERSWQDDERSMSVGMAGSSNQSHYAETLLNYFIADASTLPTILTDPPADLDFDLIIDEEGHTPLHWAVAMAKTKVVKLLVQHGADIYRVNNQGQTALMRSVLFTNNFDLKTFPSLLEILQKTIFTIDKNDQTVFHHIAVTAGMRGKVHASRYYMECLLDKLAQHPSELASIINVRDVVGDTALIIASRIGNKKVVRLLQDAGADSKIRNKSGRNADEIMHDVALAEGHLSGLPPSLFPPSSLPPQQQQLQTSTYSQQQHQSQENARLPSTSTGADQRMSHTIHQRSPHHPGGMPLSGSSSSSRVHGHPPSNLRAITPPPSRHAGYPSSSSNAPSMERPPHSASYQQDYPVSSSSSSSRNPFQSQPSQPSYFHEGGSHPGPMHEAPSGRAGYVSHTLGPHGADRGGSAEMSSSMASGERDPTSSFAPSGGRPSQRMIPMVTELLEQLTQAYENDLHTKEQDLLDARNLLHSIQTEIQEGHRTVDELRSKAVHLSQAEEQMRTLEGMIRQEIQVRQRLRLDNLVVQEESRLREEMEIEKRVREQQQKFGSSTLMSGEVDMERVMTLERQADELRRSLGQLQQSRKDQMEQMVQLKSQQGKRHQEYKRLIALCCNVSIEEVDDLLGPLLNTLGSEDGVA
ncbi:hypothetical protein BGX28_002608 [Mortierella sp. GBA30]|nr:hypothetical protein BGX28_002608 [Mortierella sp. GBA30]